MKSVLTVNRYDAWYLLFDNFQQIHPKMQQWIPLDVLTGNHKDVGGFGKPKK